jgi:hypothetical protein
MSIHVDIPSARAVNERLPAIVTHVGGAKGNLSRLRSSIDARVLNRSSLRSRLQSAQNRIDAVENELLLLHRTITQSLNMYEANEVRITTRVQNMDNMKV